MGAVETARTIGTTLPAAISGCREPPPPPPPSTAAEGGVIEIQNVQAMDVFAVAAELLGGIKLTSGQLGQLRALEYRLLLESVRDPVRSPGPEDTPAGRSGDERGAEPTGDPALRAEIEAEILEMLNPEQRADLNRR